MKITEGHENDQLMSQVWKHLPNK